MMGTKSIVFRFDDVEVREREFSLTKAGRVLTVEPKAFRALLFLLHNSQKLISKEELLNAVWGDAVVTEGSLTRCIWLLRSLLGDDIRKPRYIETVATVGYRFVCPMEVLEGVPGDLAATDSVAPHEGSAGEMLHTKPSTGRIRTVRRYWVLSGAVALAFGLTAVIWYLHRPLPPPRITAYTQITHDGHRKLLAGANGNRLYFTQTLSQTFDEGVISGGEIAQVAISGGRIAPVPVVVPNPLLLDVRTLGGFARRLGEARDASFSPDGNTVAYSTPQGEIWLVRSDGSETHKLASVGGYVSDIAWSPDSRVIRFSMEDKIWQMSSGGSLPHKLLPSLPAFSRQCCGRWTPDGKFFLFLSEAEILTYGFEIWALDERRGLLRSPPSEPVKMAGAPFRWGRPIPGNDGKAIFAEGQAPRGELSRFDAQTKQFVPFLGGISAEGAVFSKDGKSIAYVSYPEGILWKANRDGSNPVQLSEPSMWAFLPCWSPDGTQIVFTGLSRKNDEQRAYIVSSEADSPPKRLVEASGEQQFADWSPDGRKIAFDYTSVDDHGIGHLDIRIFDVDSRQITIIPGSNGMSAQRWSPDGRYLSASPSQLSLKIMDFETQQWSELTPGGIMDSPEWSRDGRYIYFRRIAGDQGIFRISVKGGSAEKIVDLKDWHDAGWYGKYMGLDPTDAPLLLRDVGSDDLYALSLKEE